MSDRPASSNSQTLSARSRSSRTDNNDKSATASVIPSAIKSVVKSAPPEDVPKKVPPEAAPPLEKDAQKKTAPEEADDKAKTATASRIKVFWKKVKKSMSKADTLPYKLPKYYNYIAAYRNELHELYEAVRTVVIGVPEEVAKAQAKQTKGPFRPSQPNGLYEKLFSVVDKVEHKKSFQHHENFESVQLMIRDLYQEEKDHQKVTGKIFADVTRFLEVDYPKVDEKMEIVSEAKKAVEEKECQLQGYPAKTDFDNNAAYQADKAALKDAEAKFDAVCLEAKKMISALLDTVKGHESAIEAWVAARGDYHEKMEKIMAKAGIQMPDGAPKSEHEAAPKSHAQPENSQ